MIDCPDKNILCMEIQIDKINLFVFLSLTDGMTKRPFHPSQNNQELPGKQ